VSLADGPEPVLRRDPYRTWIAEIMLQQTQVSTVIEYYTRWMARFPDLPSLAAAEEKEVLALWAGLGYYSRARNLLATARSVADRHGGILPPSREGLLALKGIGEYTAGAIASLAYNLPEPILDGNLVRVFSRLYGMDFLPETAAGRKAYWDLAGAWVVSAEPALVNEGLMELGALVCTPRNPTCGSCPLARHCLARLEGRVEDFPPAKRRKAPKAMHGYALVLRRMGRILLYRPRKGELLAGLLTFPTFLLDGPQTVTALRKAWAAAHPDLPGPDFRPRSAVIAHGITHHQFRLRLAGADLDAEADRLAWPEGFEWVEEERVDAALVSSLPRKIWRAWGGTRADGGGPG
jgi:A/G-specific adenine glycosylase